jgi:hypothetical protein
LCWALAGEEHSDWIINNQIFSLAEITAALQLLQGYKGSKVK